ncbi:MAG TPA: SemiSWEET transporter [Solirubrobacterales bacterium]|nr:SemiSWEET transporter [Solirubrobacterales bacterium]
MTILGLIAGTCTTLSFLPQVIRTLRTRHARDLSAAWLLIFGLGTALWLTYGLLKSDISIALANGVTFGLVMILIVAKYTLAPPEPEVEIEIDDAA